MWMVLLSIEEVLNTGKLSLTTAGEKINAENNKFKRHNSIFGCSS